VAAICSYALLLLLINDRYFVSVPAGDQLFYSSINIWYLVHSLARQRGRYSTFS